jgi:hypothetical protein
MMEKNFFTKKSYNIATRPLRRIPVLEHGTTVL